MHTILGGKTLNKICDIHTHILPNIDDGAYDIKMSIQMLCSAEKQGVNNILCTAHSWGDMHKYFHNFQMLTKEIKKENININLYPGCEIYCNMDIIEDVVSELQEGIIPTINGTKYVLVEFNPNASTREIVSCVNYIHGRGYKTIIAHIERYPKLFIDYKWIVYLKTIGCLFQVNAYSLQDETNHNIKNAARMLLSEQLVSFIGSDAHTTTHRPYMITNGIDYIHETCDNEYINNILYKNAEYFLNIKR